VAYEIIRLDEAVLTIRISGVMKLADQQSLQTTGMQQIAKGRKVRLLVTLVDFQGWEKGVDWVMSVSSWSTAMTSPRWPSWGRKVEGSGVCLRWEGVSGLPRSSSFLLLR